MATNVGSGHRIGARRWRGVCVVCRKDLWRDPMLHYASRGHRERAAAADRRAARLAAKAAT